MYKLKSFLVACIFICISGTTFGQSKQSVTPLTPATVDFELNLKISLFDFPCKVVIFQNNGSGNWDTTLSNIIPNGNGAIKGRLHYADYVLLKIFPVDDPGQMVAMQKIFIQKGSSILKWDDAEGKFKREGSKPDELFSTFQEQYASLSTLKSKAQESSNKSLTDSLSKKLLTLTRTTFNEHKNDIIGPYILTTFLSHEISPTEYDKLIASLSKEMQNTGWGINAKTKSAILKTLAIGAQAPVFSVKTIDSLAISLQKYRGHYVFIDFWASWCEPCIKEFAYIEKLNSLTDKGQLEIISVSTDQSKEKFKTMLTKHPQKWLTVLDIDNNKSLSEAYDVSRLPSNFLINPKGEIVAKDLRGEELVKVITNHVIGK